MDQPRSNFDFLDRLDGELANLGRLAESYFQDDPSTSLIKLRQFGERITRRHAAIVGIDLLDGDNQSDILRRLQYERAAPERVLDVLHHIRKLGNAAVHDGKGDHREALACLKMSVQLGVWHVRASTSDRTFSAGPFLPPQPPSSPNIELQQELDRLRAERNEALTAVQKAEEERQQAILAAESASSRHQREIEERKTWEAIAQDAERQLQEFVANAQRQAPTDKISFIMAANEAAGVIDLDEQATRALIDQQLRDRGWEANSVDLRFGKGVRPVKGRHLAIAEWPTQAGPADYALFVGEVCVGIVEAKRYRKNISAAVDQAERYSKGFSFPGNSRTWDIGFSVPFVFATNGRPYLKQVETESGIWFRDTRLPNNLRRALMGWFRPEELASMLEVEKEKAQAALRVRSFDFGFELRPLSRSGDQRGREGTRHRETRDAGGDGHWHWQNETRHRHALPATRNQAISTYLLRGGSFSARHTDERRVHEYCHRGAENLWPVVWYQGARGHQARPGDPRPHLHHPRTCETGAL